MYRSGVQFIERWKMVTYVADIERSFRRRAWAVLGICIGVLVALLLVQYQPATLMEKYLADMVRGLSAGGALGGLIVSYGCLAGTRNQ